MKEETRFQFTGRVASTYDKAVGQRQVVCLVLRVAAGKEGETEDELEVNVWRDELKEVARRCQGRQALVLGRARCKRNQHGYLNPTFSADAILVEPGTGRAYGAADSAGAPPRQGYANGGVSRRDMPSAPAPQQTQTFSAKAALGEDMAADDIPF